MAILPALNTGDLEKNFTVADLIAVLAGRLAMSFDEKTQRLSLDEFPIIFEKLQSMSVKLSFFGIAAITKFFKSALGPEPNRSEEYNL